MASATSLGSAMPPIASIRASVLLPIVQRLDAMTGKTDLLMASHGIMRSQLQDPYALVPMSRYVAFFEEAALLVRDPCFGARLGFAFRPADAGPTGMVFALSASIRNGLEKLSRSCPRRWCSLDGHGSSQRAG